MGIRDTTPFQAGITGLNQSRFVMSRETAEWPVAGRLHAWRFGPPCHLFPVSRSRAH